MVRRYKQNRKTAMKQCGRCRKYCGTRLATCTHCGHEFLDAKPRQADPTPEEIRAACRVYQLGWDERERQRRAGLVAPNEPHHPWEVPVVQINPPQITR